MNRYTSNKTWRSFTTPRLHQVNDLDLWAQTQLSRILPTLHFELLGKQRTWVTPYQEMQMSRSTPNKMMHLTDEHGRSTKCTIKWYSFRKTLYDTESDVNIMTSVTYQLLHGTMPLQPTYISRWFSGHWHEKKTTQPQPEEENHQGRMGRLRRRSGKVWRHTAWIELSWGDCSTESGKEDRLHEEEALPEPPTMPSSKS